MFQRIEVKNEDEIRLNHRLVKVKFLVQIKRTKEKENIAFS